MIFVVTRKTVKFVDPTTGKVRVIKRRAGDPLPGPLLNPPRRRRRRMSAEERAEAEIRRIEGGQR